jgi:hypothetical protein
MHPHLYCILARERVARRGDAAQYSRWTGTDPPLSPASASRATIRGVDREDRGRFGRLLKQLALGSLYRRFVSPEA